MNDKLCYSSIIIGFIIIIISIYFNDCNLIPLYILTYIGIITSILNHTTTNEFAKLLDRFIMVLTSIVYIYYCLNIKDTSIKVTAFIILFFTIITYFISKFIEKKYSKEISTNIHMLTHLLVLFLFIVINVENKFCQENV